MGSGSELDELREPDLQVLLLGLLGHVVVRTPGGAGPGALAAPV